MSIYHVAAIRSFRPRVFIETGTCNGDMIARALEAGAEIVRSVEISPHWHGRAAARFAGDSRVRLYLGDSQKVLAEMLDGFDEPLMIFLDAHFSGDPQQGGVDTPQDAIILAELAIIAAMPRNDHVILVDDTNLRAAQRAGWPVLDALREINPDYRFSQIEDALCAEPPAMRGAT